MKKHRAVGLTVAALAAGALTAGTMLVVAHPASADVPTQLYVNNTAAANCSDSGPANQEQPLCTVAAAIAIVSPGQTVNVTGTYTERVIVTKSGEPGSPISLKGAGVARLNGGVTVDGQHDVSISSVSVFKAPGTVGVTILDSTRLELKSVSVYLTGTEPSPVAGVQLIGVTASTLLGIQVNGRHSPGVSVDAKSTGNVLNSVRSYLTNSGIGLDVSGSANTIERFATSSYVGAGLSINPGADDNVVVNSSIGMGNGVGIRNSGADRTALTNNTVSAACATGIRVDGDSTDVSIQNNILSGNGNAAYNTCDKTVTDAVGIGVHDGAVGHTTIDYNSVFNSSRLYAWGTPEPTLAGFRAASGQGAHDLQVALGDTANRDSANSAAPGFPAKDVAGTPRVNDPTVPDTGAGPISYADRGTGEAYWAPSAKLTLTVTNRGADVTVDASVVAYGWTPVASYRFDFGDGTIVVQATPVATHTYAQPSDHQVSVTLTDTNGRNGEITVARVRQGSGYVPAGPVRVLDTRARVGVTTTTPVAPGGTLSLPLIGTKGIPATGVTAVVLNVTVTQPTDSGYLTIYDHGQARPLASNLDWVKGKTIANQVVVSVASGTIDFYNSLGTVHVIADLLGYYTAGAGSSLTPVGPTRLLDTRAALGVPTTTAVAPHATVTLPVAGAGGVPAAGVTAVVLNVTVTRPTTSGFLTVYPDGQPRPLASSLNWAKGKTIPNLVVVPIVNGKVNFYNGSSGTVHIIADLSGYYSAGTGSYLPVNPLRILQMTSIGAYDQLVLTDDWKKSFTDTPTNVTALVLNVTVSSRWASGFLTVYPDSQPRPLASNLNWVTGETIPNLVVVPVVNGKVVLYNGSPGVTEAIVDIAGYFTS
jgi:hypothetical protein